MYWCLRLFERFCAKFNNLVVVVVVVGNVFRFVISTHDTWTAHRPVNNTMSHFVVPSKVHTNLGMRHVRCVKFLYRPLYQQYTYIFVSFDTAHYHQYWLLMLDSNVCFSNEITITEAFSVVYKIHSEMQTLLTKERKTFVFGFLPIV